MSYYIPTKAVDVDKNDVFYRLPYPQPYPHPHLDNKLLLQVAPRPWIYDGAVAYFTPGFRRLKNVELVDDSTSIVHSTDYSKKIQFDVGQVSSNTTRIITVPDESFTMVTPDSNTILTNKTIVGSSNQVGATQFETGGVPVIITGTAPTGPGQALITTSSTSAIWLPVGGGGGMTGNIGYSLTTQKITVPNTSFVSICEFPWIQNRYLFYTLGVMIFSATIGDRLLSIKVHDATSNLDLASTTIGSSGIYVVNFVTLPTIDSQLEIRVMKTATGGVNPVINGVTLEFKQ